MIPGEDVLLHPISIESPSSTDIAGQVSHKSVGSLDHFVEHPNQFLVGDIPEEVGKVSTSGPQDILGRGI
jgi:hypothetical protein